MISQANSLVKRKLTKIAMTYCLVFAVQLAWTTVNSLNSYVKFIPDIILNVNTYILSIVSDLVSLVFSFASIYKFYLDNFGASLDFDNTRWKCTKRYSGQKETTRDDSSCVFSSLNFFFILISNKP